MNNFQAYGTLASVAQETFNIYQKEGNAWDYFLNSTKDTDPDIYPSYEEIESEEYKRDYPCEDFNFRVYQNIERGCEVPGFWAVYVCDDFFQYLDTYHFKAVSVENFFNGVKKLYPLFIKRGWVVSEESDKQATFTRA